MKETITIRIEKELLDWFRQQAKEDNRTLNNYIETFIKKNIEKEKQKTPGE